MSLPSVNQLTAIQALEQAVKASQVLKEQLSHLSQLTNEEADASQLTKVEELAAIRDTLIRQTFAHPWQEDEVKQHQAQLNLLENLNHQLTQELEEVRSSLFQQRVNNQQGRKAVNAYGNAKNQWQG